MPKRPRKPRGQSPPHPVQSTVLDLLAHSPPAAVAQRERSWTVPVADDLLEEFDGSPSKQAAELRAKAEVYEDGPEAALALADEMDRRVRSGVRYWPGSDASQRAAGAGRMELQRTPEGRQSPAVDDNVDPPAGDDFQR